MKLNPDHKFEFGKYKGLTVEEVLSLDSDYIDWCRENAPNLLQPRKKPALPAARPLKSNRDENGNWIEPPDVERAGMKENHDFLNEGPNGKGNNSDR